MSLIVNLDDFESASRNGGVTQVTKRSACICKLCTAALINSFYNPSAVGIKSKSIISQIESYFLA